MAGLALLRPLPDLDGFLKEAARTAFVWGNFDCCLWLADWTYLNTGRDGAALLRGTYFDARTCYRALEAAGGIVAVVHDCALMAGLRPLEPGQAFRPGDVGVVEVETRRRTELAGGIRTEGGLWAVLAVSGLDIAERKVAAAWRV